MATKKGSVRLSPVEKAKLYARDGYKCWLCGKFTKKKRMAPKRRRSLDHVVPKSHGGPTTPDNLITCCRQCNMFRGHSRVSLDKETRTAYLSRNNQSTSAHKAYYCFMESLTAYREFVFASRIQGIFEDPHWGIEDQELTAEEYHICTRGFIKQIERLENSLGYHGVNKNG